MVIIQYMKVLFLVVKGVLPCFEFKHDFKNFGSGNIKILKEAKFTNSGLKGLWTFLSEGV